jgi:hypothetical protein
MLLSIQFPLADIRRFLQTRTGCIDQPEWPLPAVRPEFPQNAPFVRSFGQIKPRMLGGLAFWGEDLICEATRLVRWQKPNAYAFRSNKMVLPMELAFRRFFFDGSAVAKYELGIATTGRIPFRLSAEETLKFVRWFLDHPVSVPLFSKGRRENKRTGATVIRIPASLRRSYVLATTRSSWLAAHRPDDSWVSVGIPLMVMQFSSPRESVAISTLQMRGVTLERWGVHIGCYLLKSRAPAIPLWVIRTSRIYDHTVVRQLRLCILRLHAEHECLRLVLHSLRNDKIKVVRDSAPTERLQSYLNEATRRLFRTHSTLDRLTRVLGDNDDATDEVREGDVTALAQSLFERIWPGQIASLELLMKQIEVRRNIVRKVQDYNIEVNMSKYDIHHNQEVTVIDHLQLINKEDGTEEKIDRLLKQLSTLEAEAARRAQTPEQKQAVERVTEARVAAEKGNRAGIVAKLKSAGGWIGEIAKELGSSVIAKIIEGQLGLG